VLAATILPAGAPSAKSLYKLGQKAERSGDVVRAYLLYAQAAAMDPKHTKYWERSQALRTKAALKARAMPDLSDLNVPSFAEEPEAREHAGFSSTISPEDLEEVSRMRPPPKLAADPARKKIDLRGNAKSLFEQTAKMFGLEVMFDPAYDAGGTLRLRLEDAGYREALRSLEAITNSFVVPMNSHFIFVAKDTQQKRAEFEPVVAVTVSVPSAASPQEFNELARSVATALEIQRVAFDPNRHLVLIKDRISKVIPAQELLEQLSYEKPAVDIQLQFIEVDRSSIISYGMLLPGQFPIFWLGSYSALGTVQNMAKFLFGQQFVGLGIANAQLFATMSRSLSQNLIHADARTTDGSPAAFHVGDEFPIITGGFLGENYGLPPSFNFEKLGLSMQITPHVHGTEEISLDLKSEFKMLSGQSINGIPVISNRTMEANVRLKQGQWAVVAGLMSVAEARAITGTPGLSNVPVIGRLFRKTDKANQSSEVLLLIKPRVLSLPPEDYLTRAVYIGPNMRLQIPL
jgi:general secretion pathway protein D